MLIRTLTCLLLASTMVQAQSIEQMQRLGWKLTFQDEFDGPALDAGKWVCGYHHGKIINHELQAYVPDAVQVSGGLLNLVADRGHATYDGKTMEYTSGAVTTLGKFGQAYGYFEARCKVPAGRGFWPAFWMLPVDLSWPPEIDIFEFIGHEKNVMHFTNHWRDETGKRGAKGVGVDATIDYSDDFHTYAMKWEPGRITWLVDGQPVVTSDKYVSDKPFYILLNFAVGGDWPKDPDKDTVFPSRFQIDYVRAYEKGPELKAKEKPAPAGTPAPAAPAATPAAAAPGEGPTPYPEKDPDWPGKGVVRVFWWSKVNRADFWKAREQKQGAVVACGDSLIGNWKKFESAFPGLKTANRGIGGDVSRGLLFRFQEDVLDLHPKAVIMLIGTNDLSAHGNPADTISNISAMVDLAQKSNPTLPVILCTVPPRNSPKAPTQPGKQEELNEKIKALAGGNVHVLDLGPVFLKPDGTQDPTYFSPDLLHFGDVGYAKFQEVLQKQFDELHLQ